MGRLRDGLGRTWADPDSRRAMMLSLVLHLCAFLLVMLWLNRPQPVPLEQFIVLDLGTPAESQEISEAAAVRDPAPTSPVPQVADTQTGEPQARVAEQQETTSPDPRPLTRQPEPQQATQPQAQVREMQEQAESSEASPPPQESEPEPELAQEQGDPPLAPLPEVREPAPESAVADLPQAPTATVLPEIDQVEIDVAPADRVLNIPQPQVDARVPDARNISVEASAEVTAARDIPTPAVSAQAPEARNLPTPQVQAQVPSTVPVPRPQAAAAVAEAVTIPQPQATASTPSPRSVPQPQVSATVAAPTEVPQPQVSAQVAPIREIPLPSATSQVAGTREVPLPAAVAQVEAARPLAVSPQVQVSRSVPVPEPQVAATTNAAAVAAGAAMAGAAPAGTSENPSNRVDDRIPGGNAARSGQVQPEEGAQAGNLGRAAGPEGDATGAQTDRPRIPFREQRDRPLAVLIDNAAGYPQSGLTSASVIAEMPVEGGLTRLMTLYDVADPGAVGPIRSARDYFVELARIYDGVLVHDGGSPAALAALERGPTPSLNAYRFGDLFSRNTQRGAPYNLYANGTTLREAVNRLDLDRLNDIRGVVPRPPEEAPSSGGLSVRFGGSYSSGFSYIQQLDVYRWQRNGENAVDASGEAVFVDAVLLARIDARPIPDDPLGRLYIPLRGGEATLYLRGKAVEGSWAPASGDDGQGLLFVSEGGEEFDLAPFRTWLMFAPDYAQVTTN